MALRGFDEFGQLVTHGAGSSFSPRREEKGGWITPPASRRVFASPFSPLDRDAGAEIIYTPVIYVPLPLRSCACAKIERDARFASFDEIENETFLLRVAIASEFDEGQFRPSKVHHFER